MNVTRRMFGKIAGSITAAPIAMHIEKAARAGLGINATGVTKDYAQGEIHKTLQQGYQSKPLMSWDEAKKVACNTPAFREALMAQTRERHSGAMPTSIDPDIMVIRSFSPMFKVHLQRERNIMRDFESQIGEKEIAHNFIGNYLNELIYGKDWNKSL